MTTDETLIFLFATLAEGLPVLSDFHDTYRGASRGADINISKVGARLADYQEAE